jgi:hypothetical protein
MGTQSLVRAGNNPERFTLGDQGMAAARAEANTCKSQWIFLDKSEQNTISYQNQTWKTAQAVWEQRSLKI